MLLFVVLVLWIDRWLQTSHNDDSVLLPPMGSWKFDFSSRGCVILTEPRKGVRDPKVEEGNGETREEPL